MKSFGMAVAPAAGLLLVAASLGASCSSRSALPARGGKAPHPALPVAAAVRAAGSLVYRDPATGQLGAPPPSAVSALQRGANANTSQVGLQETASPAGGTMIDLQGRFQAFARVRRGADGKLDVACDNQAEPARP